MLKTELGFSLSSYFRLPRAQALPSKLKFLTTRGTDHSSKTPSLSLSPGNSCSNELNQSSDATEDHDHGYQLNTTGLSESLHLLMSDSTCLIWTLSASYASKFFCSPKRDQISQLLTHLSQLCTLAIPNKLSILLHTQSFLHQTLHILAYLCPPNHASVRLQTPVLSPRTFSLSGSIPFLHRLVFFVMLPNRHPS
jgi:hypothetical protein